jgi:hypothetical protein
MLRAKCGKFEVSQCFFQFCYRYLKIWHLLFVPHHKYTNREGDSLFLPFCTIGISMYQKSTLPYTLFLTYLPQAHSPLERYWRHGLWVSHKIPAISGHREDCMVFKFISKLTWPTYLSFGTPGCIRRFINVLRSNWVLGYRLFVDARCQSLQSNDFSTVFCGWNFGGGPVLNSSPEIETLIHTMALVFNRGMLVKY